MRAAVGFDFDHTLGVDNGLERRAFLALLEEAGAPLADGDEAGRTAIDDALSRFRSWTVTLADAIGEVRASSGRPWALHGPADERYRKICFDLVDTMVQPVEGARDALDALAATGIPFAILTNGWAPLQQKKIARALGALNVPILVSETLGVQKPERAAFDALCAALGTVPAQTWYVGDNPVTDVAGAIAAGLHGVWFDWEQQRYPGDAPPPSATVHRLADVLAVVRGSQAAATKKIAPSDGTLTTLRRDAP